MKFIAKTKNSSLYYLIKSINVERNYHWVDKKSVVLRVCNNRGVYQLLYLQDYKYTPFIDYVSVTISLFG